jgi:hypothetical protein
LDDDLGGTTGIAEFVDCGECGMQNDAVDMSCLSCGDNLPSPTNYNDIDP